jgi:hypothetical protein
MASWFLSPNTQLGIICFLNLPTTIYSSTRLPSHTPILSRSFINSNIAGKQYQDPSRSAVVNIREQYQDPLIRCVSRMLDDLDWHTDAEVLATSYTLTPMEDILMVKVDISFLCFGFESMTAISEPRANIMSLIGDS